MQGEGEGVSQVCGIIAVVTTICRHYIKTSVALFLQKSIVSRWVWLCKVEDDTEIY